MPPPIRIAISGGGLAGATLLYALLPQPHLDVHIFESTSAVKESGAALGIGSNAQAALELISATQCLERAGAVQQKAAQAMMGLGENQGSIICLIGAKDGRPGTRIVHRAALVRELLASVPLDRIHVSKKLESVDHDTDGSLTIHLYVCCLFILLVALQITASKILVLQF